MKETRKNWTRLMAVVLTGVMLFGSVQFLPGMKAYADEFTPEAATDAEVAAIMDGSDKDTVLVDARPQEAYAGWALQGAKNGGHIKDAVLWSARFLTITGKKAASKLDTYNGKVGLDTAKSYIVYDYDCDANGNEAEKVAQYLHGKGIENVKTYDAKSVIDEGKDLEKDKNYQMYLPSEMVKDISDYKTGKDMNLEAETLAQFTESEIKDKVLLFDVDYGNVFESQYMSDGHVPGAVHMNTNAYERPRQYVPEKREEYSVEYRLIGLEEFRDELCPQYGINKDSIVIAISRDGRPISRFGFMLKSIGVEFYGMSGLMNSWTYNGYDVEKKVNKPVSVDSFGSDYLKDDQIIWIDEVKKILSGEEKGVVIGGSNYSTYSYNDLMGTIEGIKEDGCYYTNPDGTPSMKEILAKDFAERGYDTNELIVPFCGDGWGASRDAYNAQSVGFENVKYWGEGWVVWGNEGNWFITKSGQKVRYNKYRDCLQDENGNDVNDPEAMKAE